MFAHQVSAFSPDRWSIPQLPEQARETIQQHIDNKTKPLGALGQLEQVAAQLALIQFADKSAGTQIRIARPTLLLFAADHGIARHNISIAPQAVTRQMLLNFLSGGAAINCFCRTHDMAIQIVDAGILNPVKENSDELLEKRIGPGTADFTEQSAMSLAQCCQALENGAQVAKDVIAKGANVLGFGEMGIGNTSSASALVSALTAMPVDKVTGYGTGISEDQLALKIKLLRQALQRVRQKHGGKSLSPEIALSELGGFEIAQITGAMLATAAAGKTILVDGFIVSVAALIATRIVPGVRQYMLFAHQSAELAHQKVLNLLGATPLLDLQLRLGEGTGAALALPLLRSAASFYNQMASFEDTNVIL